MERIKTPSKPLKITAHLLDGRFMSSDGVIMLDAILYHAWFSKYAPHVLQGMGEGKHYYMGLPLKRLPGNRYEASRGAYTEIAESIEYINKKPNFFDSNKIDYMDENKGHISNSVGLYRAYRIPSVIRTVKDKTVTFWAMGKEKKVKDLLDRIPSIGKKGSAGYGIVERWDVEKCEEDYSLWHPEHGLMRPVEVDSEEASNLDLSGYPIMQYGIKPPYHNPKNMRMCYVPICGK